ncbi:MAG: PEP-CTERM sorting domain-containing protein, partial [Chthoniobacterales bacterium]
TIDGTLLPGDIGIGAAKFDSDLTFGPTATTGIQLASASSFDTINVGGTLTLDGTITVTTTGGYVVPLGASYQIISWNVLVSSGFNPSTDFDFSGATMAPDVHWDTAQFLTNGTLVAVPEPAEWRMILLGLSALALLRRRRISGIIYE